MAKVKSGSNFGAAVVIDPLIEMVVLLSVNCWYKDVKFIESESVVFSMMMVFVSVLIYK